MKDSEKAYIAGFLDADGSIMLQFKPRKDCKFGFRVKTVICFYQDTSHNLGLKWIQERIGAGYLSTRNDNMSELRLEGYTQTERLLSILEPYLIFKKDQVSLLLKAITILKKKPSINEFLQIAKISDQISELNYKTRKKIYSYKFVKKSLENKFNTPLTTEI